jgi:hypothetical protein
MAYIIRDDGRAVVTKSAQSVLGRADFDRVHDCYRLALRGDPQCRRLWNDFEIESPDRARTVVAYAAKLDADHAKANKSVDKFLAKAEGASSLPGRSGRKARKELRAKAQMQQNRAKALRQSIKEELNNPDPAVRETARAVLLRGGL